MKTIARKTALPLPWYCHAGFNVLVLWNFVTFALDSTDVFGRGVSLGVTSAPWVVFACAQAAMMGLLTAFSDAIENSLSRSGHFRFITWGAALLSSTGVLALFFVPPAPRALIAVCSGAASAWLWLVWALYFSRLEPQEAEGVIVESAFANVLAILVFLMLPASFRLLAAQIIPLFSAGCSLHAVEWIHESRFQRDADRGFSRDSGKPLARMTLRELFGLALPATLVFMIIPLFGLHIERAAGASLAVSVLLGFVLAAGLTYAFLRYTPSVTLAFIFRWQVPLIAIGLVMHGVGLSPIAGHAMVVCSLIVISESIWICLSRAMRLHPDCALRVFVRGYFVFDAGVLAGSLCAAAVFPAVIEGTLSFDTITYLLLLVVIAGLAVMVHVPAKKGVDGPPMDFARTDACEGEPVSADVDDAISEKAEQAAPQADIIEFSQEFGGAVLTSSAGALRTEQAPDSSSANASVLGADALSAQEAFFEAYSLTPREREIAAYLAKGRSVPFIRDELFISANTANTHIKHIYAKTDTNGRQDLLDLMESYRFR